MVRAVTQEMGHLTVQEEGNCSSKAESHENETHPSDTPRCADGSPRRGDEAETRSHLEAASRLWKTEVMSSVEGEGAEGWGVRREKG